jgi:hypothetical protein
MDSEEEEEGGARKAEEEMEDSFREDILEEADEDDDGSDSNAAVAGKRETKTQPSNVSEFKITPKRFDFQSSSALAKLPKDIISNSATHHSSGKIPKVKR